MIVTKNQKTYEVYWNNGVVLDEVLIQKAKERRLNWDKKRLEENFSVDLQMFILENPAETAFKKKTPGGMFQSKKYFPKIAVDVKNSSELATKLNLKTWEQFENQLSE